jgi:putative thioredoxin
MYHFEHQYAKNRICKLEYGQTHGRISDFIITEPTNMSNETSTLNSGISGTGYSASYGGNQVSGQSAPSPASNAATNTEARPAVIDITTAEFGDAVIKASNDQIVLVDFWAPWCEPCKQLGPILEKAVKASDGKVILTKMDIDKHPEVAGQMGIKSIPAVVAFVDGKPVDALMGAVPESQIKAFFDKLPSPANPTLAPIDEIAAAMEKAGELLNAGDAAQAAEVFVSVLDKEQGNLDAIAGLGTCYLAVGELELARNIVSSLPEEHLKTPSIAELITKLELAEQAAKLGSISDLEKAVEDNPKDHQAKFDLAVALNAHNKRDEAAVQLLEIVAADRKWNDDGARAQLVQFFDLWGPTDPATLTGRRGLSSILFS